METINDDDAPNGRGALQNKHYEPVSDRAGKLIERFKATKLRHHRDFHADLAEAAECQKLFLEHPYEYNKYIKNYFKKFTNKKPRGRETSHDLMICSYQAVTRDDIRQAGTHARVIDYMIAKGVTNFGAFLKEHNFSGVLELARQETPRNKRPKAHRPVIKVYLDKVSKKKFALIKNSAHEIEFDLFCKVTPGQNPKILAKATTIIQPNQPDLPKSEQKALQNKLKRVNEARSLLDDRMLYAAGWPDPDDA